MSEENEKILVDLPPLMDIVQPNGTKICPVMGNQILIMPTKPAGSVLSTQQVKQEYIRHFTPCVGVACQWWDSKAVDCKISLSASAFVDSFIRNKTINEGGL